MREIGLFEESTESEAKKKARAFRNSLDMRDDDFIH